MAFFDDDLPGGSGYLDASSVFLDAVPGLAQEQMLMMKNFTLHDAMMAIEVMDPRMDSGVVKADSAQVQFNPLNSLLPEEVCWIMDRMFAAEMLWHAGSALSQSIYTCLYVHEIGPGRLWNGSKIPSALLPPYEPHQITALVNIVLRAAVYGLLKTCDIAWRELTKGHVLEMEDFNGEKADRYICETVHEADVLRMLDAAKAWLLSRQAASITWRAELIARIELRRDILIALSYSVPDELRHYEIILRQAQQHLRDIRALKTPPSPKPTSPAYHAFDPSIHRRLLSVMPLKVVALPEQQDAWERYHQFLNGLQELGALSACNSILEIKELLDLRASLSPSPSRTGIVRSLSRTAISSKLGYPWSNKFFEEMANVPPPITMLYLPMSFGRPNPPPRLQASIDKMVDDYLSTFFSNRPRQRRRLCNWISEWTSTIPQLESFIAQQNDGARELRRLSLALSILRLKAASHIILSGLELELHETYELPFVYWYGERLHTAMQDKLAALSSECERAPTAVTDYLSAELAWTGLIGKFFQAAFTISILFTRPLREGGALREESNLRRRFKWAFASSRHPSHLVQHSGLMESFAPNLDEWNAVRARVQEQPAEAQLATCSDMFHKLEEATKLYEGILLLRKGLTPTEALREGVTASQHQQRHQQQPAVSSSGRVEVSGSVTGTVQDRTWALRLNVVRQLQEVASTNIKSLSILLGTSELVVVSSRGNSEAGADDRNTKASGEVTLAGAEAGVISVVGAGASPSEISIKLNEVKILPSRWFPMITLS